jgi:hypothetical protein
MIFLKTLIIFQILMKEKAAKTKKEINFLIFQIVLSYKKPLISKFKDQAFTILKWHIYCLESKMTIIYSQ